MIKSEGIILTRTLYGTDSIILNILSPEGLFSGIYKGLSRRTTSVHAAETQIGSWIEYVAYPSRSTGISHIKEIHITPASTINLPLSPFRTAQKIFMCDITRSSIRGTVSDSPLYHLLKDYLYALHTSSQRYLCMIYAYELCSILGFEPQKNQNTAGLYFDMCEGIFTPSLPTHKYYLTPLNAVLFFSLNIKEDTSPLSFSTQKDWEKTWHILMTYYSLHVTDFYPPRSLEYLQEITRLEFFP